MRFLSVLCFLVLPVSLFSVPDMFPNEYYKYTLHVLLLCDTSNPDTRASHLADIKRMKSNVKGIAVQCKLKLRLHVLQGEALTEKNILQWIEQMTHEKGRNFIYYSGGENKNVINDTKWPAFHLMGKSKELWTAETMREKVGGIFCHYKLSLVACDCYDSMRAVSKKYCDMPSRIRRKGPQKGLPYLFWKPLSSIAIASCEKGKIGYGIIQGKEQGGLLTLMLCRGLERATVKPLFWDAVLSEIEGNCFNFAALNEYKKAVPLKQRVLISPEKEFLDPECPFGLL